MPRGVDVGVSIVVGRYGYHFWYDSGGKTRTKKKEKDEGDETEMIITEKLKHNCFLGIET